MKIVEFFGASGVGKSTTYRELCRLGGMIPALDIDYSGSEAILREAAAQDDDLRAFVDLVDRVFRTARGPRIKTRRNHTYRSLRMTIQNQRSPLNDAVVIDGGLLQRGQAIDRLESDVPLEDYYRAMPAPDMAVMFTARPETIRARNIARGGDHDRSRDVQRSAEVHAIAQEIMGSRGVWVIVVDTEKPAAENAGKIHAAIASL